MFENALKEHSRSKVLKLKIATTDAIIFRLSAEVVGTRNDFISSKRKKAWSNDLFSNVGSHFHTFPVQISRRKNSMNSVFGRYDVRVKR
jgi:hypothetical protein